MPPIITVVVLAVVFTTALAIVQGLYWAWIAREEQSRRDLSRRLGMLAEGNANEAALFRDRARDAAGQALGTLGEHLQATIEAADADTSVSQLLMRMGVAGVALALPTLLFVGFLPSIVIGLVGAVLPYGLLRRAAEARSKKLVEQLPDSLDLIARSLQAGVSVNDAFRMVAEEMPMPIAGEFGRIFEEIRFGRDFRAALEMLLVRNPGIFDLRLFVSSVLLARETGGNLIEVLDNISQTIRGRFLFEAKVRAMTSEARASAMILGGLPLSVGLFLSILNPTYVSPLFTDPLGNMFLGYSATSYSVGMFVMNKMSQVEV